MNPMYMRALVYVRDAEDRALEEEFNLYSSI
jgi:hypothetical protein